VPSFWLIVDRAMGEGFRAALSPKRGRYPLSPMVEDIVRRRAGLGVSSPRLRMLDRLVGELGRAQPDWPHAAMQALAHGGWSKVSSVLADAAATLLAAREGRLPFKEAFPVPRCPPFVLRFHSRLVNSHQ